MPITEQDVEELVAQNGYPSELIVSVDDFKAIYAVLKRSHRDATGVFILVVNTQIRPKVDPQAGQRVDISAQSAFVKAVVP